MRLTKKNSPKSYTIYYLPQEIKETMVTEVSYLPITRERLEQFFKDAASITLWDRMDNCDGRDLQGLDWQIR